LQKKGPRPLGVKMLFDDSNLKAGEFHQNGEILLF